MTEQYLSEDINIGPNPSNAQATAFDASDQQGSDVNNDAVMNFLAVTISSTNDFTVALSDTLGTTITILQPGAYMASLNADVAAGNSSSIAISVGGTANNFGATPAAIGGAAAIIALSSSIAGDASVPQVSTFFRIAPADLNGTANVVRFLGTANAVWTATTLRARIDRLTAF